MAKQQYRVYGQFEWVSNSGNALIALVNKNNSGKKITIRSMEIIPLMSMDVATAPTTVVAVAAGFTLARATNVTGSPVTLVANDSNSTWPSMVSLLKDGSIDTESTTFHRSYVLKQLVPSGLSWYGRHRPYSYGRLNSAPRDDADEKFTVRAGECLALYASTFRAAFPLRVTATIIRDGTPAQTFNVSYLTSVLCPNHVIFAIKNESGSGETIFLRDLSIEEVGTFESPYFQVVPTGGLIESNVSTTVTALRLDTSYDDPSTFVEIKSDCPFFPFGQPENAFADASAGSPKGFNYLKTKDFLGPTYRVFFPELTGVNSAAAADARFTVNSHANTDIMVRKSNIVIREGEGIAIVSSAETAAGATTAVTTSGWSPIHVGITFDVEPARIPIISGSGIVEGSRYRIERVSDNSLVSTGLVGPSGTFSFEYTEEDTPLELRLRVRKASSGSLYKPFEVQFTQTSADVNIPVSQILDE